VSARLPALRTRSILALGGLLASSWIVAAPLDVVRACAATASPGLSGIKDLAASCPQLPDALATLGLEDVLEEGWREQLNTNALRGLTELADRYRGAKWQTPDTAALAGILSAMKREQAPQSESWWESLKAWFKHWLSQSNSSVLQWLNRWLDAWLSPTKVSAALVKVIAYCSTALVLLAALVVIVNELKAAGVLRRRPRAADAAHRGKILEASGEGGAVALPTGSHRLTELLRVLVNLLMRTGRLKMERSLTHRELIAHSSFDNEAQRAAFAGVARTAETMLYGPNGAAPEQLAHAIEQGEGLVAGLSLPGAV
jgi:hypothetical protein